MWLLNTHEQTLQDFQGRPEEYAILSHRWHDPQEEVSYAELTQARLTEDQLNDGNARSNSYGWKKIYAACAIARQRDVKWIWYVGCSQNRLRVCHLTIVQGNNTELSEAINSMYAWYRDARECYAFLDDVPQPETLEATYQDFSDSRWWSRGWTLQELLAPRIVRFYGMNYNFIGTRQDLFEQISQVTGIDRKYLGTRGTLPRLSIHSASVAERMSWACMRETTKAEDIAYSLLGIFDVNMPLLYGEGDKAFTRLQTAIIAQTRDDSIFAWGIGEHDQLSGMLARSPRDFKGSGAVVNLPDPGQAKTQADLMDVFHTSIMPVRAALAALLFGAHPYSRDMIRLRCIQLQGKTPFTLWLGLKCHQDGYWYRDTVTRRSTRWLNVPTMTLQRFVRYPKQVSVSAVGPPNPTVAEKEIVEPRYWWDYLPATALLRITFALRLLTILAILLLGVFGHPGCHDGTDTCQSPDPILIFVLGFFLRDLFVTRIQFWAIISLWLLLSGFRISVSTGDESTLKQIL
ncbi:hypothetical protein LTR56_007197 [Elasticomyces elasticus]|nr:hypothetical protein LTR22_014398 [Elasticomyces elasticus]KAK3649065.1 hypothetical protein LTR56_007197 [Elasticomyces elasticus]KAK4913218.1 hypothetical protein LTR49_018393 [Elasticomyces elasticus]KAK5752234.1 hypothetical protein LTS12_017731 [Elasticomyces elasticus]